VPDGTKIEQDYTTFDCAVLRKFFPVGNFVVHPPKGGELKMFCDRKQTRSNFFLLTQTQTCALLLLLPVDYSLILSICGGKSSNTMTHLLFKKYS
jgi:hypothetical protein